MAAKEGAEIAEAEATVIVPTVAQEMIGKQILEILSDFKGHPRVESKSQEAPEKRKEGETSQAEMAGDLAEDPTGEGVAVGDAPTGKTRGFLKIRKRPKRYWISSLCNSKLSMEVTLRFSSMLSKRNSITN